MQDLSQLLQRLHDAKIEFVIVGGFGAILHGATQLTQDLDVCAVLTGTNVDRLRNAFRDLHPTHRFTPQRLSFLENPEPGVGVQNLYLQTDIGTLDLLGSIAGVGDYERVAARSIEIELYGRRVRVIGIEDLIKTKETLGRDKDFVSLRQLRSILEKSRC